MKSLTEIINDVVKATDAELEFVSGDKAYQNLSSDNVESYPAVFMDTPIKFLVEYTKSGYVRLKYNLIILFVDKTDLNASEDDKGEVVLAMTNTMLDFIAQCDKNADILNFYPTEGYEVIDVFDANLSGVVLLIDVVPKFDRAIC